MGLLAFLMGHGESAGRSEGAPSSSALAQAWTEVEAAQGLAEARKPAEALASWQRAYDLSADPVLLLEVGRLERELGNQARATHAFEQYLANGAERLSEPRRQLALRQLQAAAAGTARLNLRTNVLGASVELEPQRGVATESGFSINVLVDAGERRLSLSKPGYETRSLVLSLEPGESRTLRVDLDKAAGGRSETGSSKPRWTLLGGPGRSTTTTVL